MCFVCLVPLIPMGFLKSSSIDATLAFYYIAIFFSTFANDILIYGYEQLTKAERAKYIIVLTSTRIIGIAVVCGIFYWT